MEQGVVAQLVSVCSGSAPFLQTVAHRFTRQLQVETSLHPMFVQCRNGMVEL